MYVVGLDIVNGQGTGGDKVRERSRRSARRLGLLAAVLTIAAGLLASQPAFPQAGATAAKNAEDFIKVRYEAGTSLRGLAEKYLNDPDLWPIILRLNSIDNISDLQEGQEFLLPANQVKLSASALDASLVEI